MTNQQSQLLRSAVEQYRAGDMAAASKLFEQVVQRDPANQQAWMGLAVCTDNLTRKQQYLKRVVALNADTKIGKQAHDKLIQLSAPAPAPAPVPAVPAIPAPAAFPDTAQMLARILEEVLALRAEVAHLRNGVPALPVPEPEPIAPPVPESEAEPEPASASGLQRVTDLLAAHDVTIESIRACNTADAVFDQLAVQLGNNYQQLSFFYTNLRRYLNIDPTRRSDFFNLSLNARSQQEIAITTNFCTNLLKYAFVQKYRYDRNTKMVYLSPQMTGDIPSFFTGYWFERYIFKRVCDLLDAAGMDYTALANVKMRFPDGDGFELDMLFLIKAVLLWVECKTGNFEDHIAKYSKHRRAMNIPKSRALLVVLELDPERADALSSIHSLTFVGHEQIDERIQMVLEASDTSEDEEQSPSMDTPSAPGKPPELFSLLNKVQLRPYPELRPTVLTATLDYARTAPKPLLLRDVKEVLAQQHPRISKAKLQNLLNAVVRGECLLDDKGEVVRSFTQPFVRLVSEDPAVLETRCQRAYIQAIIREQPHFFTQRQHFLDFEKVVGNIAHPDLVEAVRALPPS